MMRRSHRFRQVLGAAWLLLAASCTATPLPTPPNLDEERIHVEQRGDGQTGVRGDPGAVEPPGYDVRVTYADSPTTVGLPSHAETGVGADGSFEEVLLPAPSDARFFIEILLEDEDLFLGAVEAAPGSGSVRVDPGPDRDGDGSPDVIDCAPDDETLVGQRCP